jgi:hypothetical protein
MVKLTLEQQRSFVQEAPDAFRPCRGTCGERGATNLQLLSVSAPRVRAALAAAYRNVVCEEKRPVEPASRIAVRGPVAERNRKSL